MTADPTDVIAAHQIALSRLPPLTAGQERWLTYRILAARRRYCRAALEIDHVARHFAAAVAAATGNADGSLNADRNTAITPHDLLTPAVMAAAAKDEVKPLARAALAARAATSLPTVSALLARGTPAARRKAAKLLLELCPRIRAVEQAVAESRVEFGADTGVADRRLAVWHALRRRMADANTRLVSAVAKRNRGTGSLMEDVIGDGHKGLLKAIDHFDPRWGFKFSTMATGWVEQAITRSTADSTRAVRLPAEVRERAGLAFWAASELRGTLGREPTWDEVSAHVKRTKGKSVSGDKLREADAAVQPTASIGSDEDGHEVTWGGSAGGEAVEAAERREAVGRVLLVLSYTEREVLKLRYGLGDGWAYTLEECGRVFRVTRQRAKQIEAAAFKKLRKQGVASLLEGHL